MSDTILTGDFTIYYGVENRQKRIKWSGSAAGTRTVNELYSALQDQFDELNQMDDGTPMSAQTPTEYTIGIIDPGDKDPWFIDRETIEHLQGGAIKTASWTRTTGTNTGIVKLTVDNSGGTPIVAGDIGLDITTGTNTGTLLDIRGSGATTYLWIRPDSNAAGNNFDDSGTLTCNAHTCTFTYSIATGSETWETGESLWANIYSIGTLEDQSITHLYVIQDKSKLISQAAASTYDWWLDGHIDILLLVKEADAEIDEAVVQVFARHYSKTFDHFEVDLTNGGRNPIPLSTGEDLNNTTGVRTATHGAAAPSAFTLGNYLYVGASWTAATKKVVPTKIVDTTHTDYYLIGKLTDLAGSDVIKEYNPSTSSDTGNTATVSAVADKGDGLLNNGPAYTDANYTVSVTHGAAESYDVDENGSNENYSIVIDCASRRVGEVYQWSKWLSRRGETTHDADSDYMDGEQYIGSDYKIVYTTLTGTLTQGNTAVGDVVQGATSGARGTITAHNTTDKIIILRNSRGTFTNGEEVKKVLGDGSLDNTNKVATTTFTRITPIKAAPYGTFAGGKWFCAPGVVLINVPNADANNYQLTDDDGNVVVAPTKVTLQVTNTRAGDKIAVFRLSSGDIEKTYYSFNADAAIGATSIVVTPSIRVDEPGKSVGGVLRVVDNSANKEYRLRYASYSGSTFTLATIALTGNLAGGTNTTTLVTTGGQLANAKVGDLVYNTTRTATSYITVKTDSNNATIFPAIASQVSTDTINLNVVPVAFEDASPGPADNVYVPFLDVYETTGDDTTTGSESAIITYSSDIPVRVRARQAGNILPYESPATISTSGMSNNVIRTPDSIFNP